MVCRAGRSTPIGTGEPSGAAGTEQTLGCVGQRLGCDTKPTITGVLTALHEGVIKGDNPNAFGFIDDAWGYSNSGWGWEQGEGGAVELGAAREGGVSAE